MENGIKDVKTRCKERYFRSLEFVERSRYLRNSRVSPLHTVEMSFENTTWHFTDFTALFASQTTALTLERKFAKASV